MYLITNAEGKSWHMDLAELITRKTGTEPPNDLCHLVQELLEYQPYYVQQRIIGRLLRPGCRLTIQERSH